MNGYTKIKISPSSNNYSTLKSRSMDFSDSFPFPQTLKPIGDTDTTTIRAEEPKQIKKKSSPERREGLEDDGEEAGRGVEHGSGEGFGVILGRCATVSSSASGFQATVKRAFSMRRSSSVSERYCRIHDQYVALASPNGHDIGVDEIGGRRSVKKKQKGSKILRACKRLLGL